jgi:primosomal protein N'
MARSTIHCPHCKKSITVEVGERATCPKCGGEMRVHEVGANEENEALKRLLSRVKIVERVDRAEDAEPAENSEEKPAEKPKREPKKAAPPAKRPWWKFWG